MYENRALLNMYADFLCNGMTENIMTDGLFNEWHLNIRTDYIFFK